MAFLKLVCLFANSHLYYRSRSVDGLTSFGCWWKGKTSLSAKCEHYASPFVSFSECMDDTLYSHTEPSGGASGQASDIAIHAKEILRIRQVLTSIYQRHCARPDESEAEGLARFGEFQYDCCVFRPFEPVFHRKSSGKRLLYDRYRMSCLFWSYSANNV